MSVNVSGIKANLKALDIDKDLFQSFAHFLDSSNILEFAVATILGTQFKQIIDNFVENVLSPIVAKVTSQTGSLDDLYFVIGDAKSRQNYASWQEATARGANVIRYGAFLQAVMNFMIQTWIVFLILRAWIRAKHTFIR